jgi:hypothetical protein
MPRTKLGDSDGDALGSCNEDDVRVREITVGKVPRKHVSTLTLELIYD